MTLVTPQVLWLPKPPDNANARQHWRTALNAKRKYWRELDLRAALCSIPPPPARPCPTHEALIEWHYPDGRWHLDDDNAIRRMKPAFDWLVTNGYLAGDTSGHLRILPVVTIILGAIGRPHLSTVRLTLTPIPGV